MRKKISLFIIVIALIVVYATILFPNLWENNSYPQSRKSLDTINIDSINLQINDTLYVLDRLFYPYYFYTPDIYVQDKLIKYVIINGDTIRNIKGIVKIIMKEGVDIITKEKKIKYFNKTGELL